MLAAIRAARKAGASTINAAAPIASPAARELVQSEADHVVVLQTPALLSAVGQWYEHFEQLENAEACRLLTLDRKNQDSLLNKSGRHREAG